MFFAESTHQQCKAVPNHILVATQDRLHFTQNYPKLSPISVHHSLYFSCAKSGDWNQFHLSLFQIPPPPLSPERKRMWGNLSGNDICKADWMFAGINKHDKWLVLSSSPPLAFPYT
jgi:hypothetical protein